MKIDFEQLQELIKTLEASDLSEIDIRQGQARIRLRRGPLGNAQVLNVEPPRGRSAPPTAVAEDGVVYITSPFVGTFYRGASPDGDPFIDTGQQVRVGAVLCIVEAMKLMNEIESEVAGTVVEVLVENGKPVEYGDRLFKIKTGV